MLFTKRFWSSFSYGGVNTAVGDNLRSTECWFRLTNNIDNTLNEAQALVFKYNINSVGNFGLYFGQSDWVGREGRLVFERRVGGNNHFVVSNNNSWTSNVWHHVTGVIDPVNGMELYIDGVKQTDTEPSTQTTDITSLDLNVGSWSGNNRFFKGDIDNIRLWTRALSETGINANSCSLFNAFIQTGLRAYWNFDYDTGSNPAINVAATSYPMSLFSGATRTTNATNCK